MLSYAVRATVWVIYLSALHPRAAVCIFGRIATADARFLDGVRGRDRLRRPGDDRPAVWPHGALPICHRPVGRRRHLSLMRPCFPIAAKCRSAATAACDVPTRRSQAYGKQQRRGEGKDCGGECGDSGPDGRRAEECAGLAEIAARVDTTETAPHPADHGQMREEHKGKAKPQRTGRPGKVAADGMDGIDKDERAAPDEEPGREPPEISGRQGTRARGHVPRLLTRAGSAATRLSAITPVTTV